MPEFYKEKRREDDYKIINNILWATCQKPILNKIYSTMLKFGKYVVQYKILSNFLVKWEAKFETILNII